MADGPPRAVPIEPSSLGYAAAKRVLDVVLASLVLTLALVPLVLCMLVIRLESRGPAIFRQVRVGIGGREFVCLKLRTMRSGNDSAHHQEYLAHIIEHGDSVIATHMPDREITRVGRLLRKISADELPQLINVLRGDMSLVGPRPPIPYEVARYRDWHMRRLSVKPGLTGYWQVKGRARVTFDDMCRMDIEYIKRRNLWLDLKIIAMTPIAALRGSG